MNIVKKPKDRVQDNLQKFFTKKSLRLKTDEGVISLPLVAWDSISSCNGENCPVGLKQCPYGRKLLQKMAEEKVSQKCLVQAKYLRLVYQNLVTSNTKKRLNQLDEMTMTNIGLLLLPLYGHLIKFKLVEASLSLNDTIVQGKPHPVYKAIRDTMTAIREACRDILPTNLQKLAANQMDVGNILDINAYHDKLEKTVEQEYLDKHMALQS